MLLLAVDTATPAVTAALHDGSSVVAESSSVDARRHGELLLPAVDRVLAEAGVKLDAVTAVVAGVGPGPYTGLRVGLVTAATFGSALGVPVYGLCTLDGLAYASGLQEPFVVATDARRKEVYWARYESARARVGEPSVDRPADIAEQLAGLPAVGAGALLYPEAFPDARGPEHVSAGALAALAAEKLAAGDQFLPPLPLYLRRPDAQVPKNYKVVTPK
ncbi:tRNA (adenosine(37)-N6)-threonylcarbamoyltransferase complex dimerization subunit type 1 TsaB [Streptomyces sp. NBC_00322]|uniref:tRNA (adenosine(37)-N6)-threonylcarbamoyltransferase complex dimerization subunit type 1 TsaB n=1 Tax=Streptomyces sp. NBC_00322 TaxID=2975712 RepID=UPI002E2A57BE|nr:tRNA (adenosine(37)-N6)-threonylcarbamoyltransferase complex dimerization subunit type 1 TsaB [Streptomyces sp. NBC_00322]